MNINTSIFEKTEPLKDSFLLFLDILGFSEKVKSDLTGSVELLKKIRDDVIRLNKTESWLKDLKGITFSDSIIFTVPFNANQAGYFTAASLIIKIASYYQNVLLANGYLSRGYIGRSSMYHDDSIIVGEALIKASKCEKAIGDKPIIVVDTEIIEWANRNQNIDNFKLKKEQGWIHILDRLLLDNEGLFYIDFLRDSGILASEKITIEDYAMRTINVAQKNIAQYIDRPDISTKWSFLENYASGILK